MAQNVNILTELKELNAEKLIGLERADLYAYPNNYFNDLTEDIMRTVWLHSFKTIIPYSVPLNYFENLAELIVDKSALSFKNITSKQLYNIPENYFDNLADNILQKLKKKNDNVDEELKTISPLLGSIDKKNVYTVPAGYFESTTFGKRTHLQQSAKVVSIAGKTRNWSTYAAAACVAVMVSIGGYFYIENKFPGNASGKTLAGINVEKAVSQLSDSTINNYLQSDNSDAYTSSNPDNDDLNIQTLLENTSDEEIENYLIENPEIANDSKGI